MAYLIGAAILFAAQKLNLLPPSLTPTPAGPSPATPAGPSPATPATPAVPQMDKPLADFIPWLISAKAGQIRLDDQDREGLQTVRTLMAALAAPPAKP